MRLAVAVIALFLSVASPALANDTEGTIQSIDTEKMTITLDDGQTYTLPAEMDVSGIETGMDIIIAYRVDEDGQKQITDMVLPE